MKKLRGSFVLENEGLPGVPLHMKENHLVGTVTDINGNFELQVPADRSFVLIIGACICTKHHDVRIDKDDAVVKLSVRKCKGRKRTIKKVGT